MHSLFYVESSDESAFALAFSFFLSGLEPSPSTTCLGPIPMTFPGPARIVVPFVVDRLPSANASTAPSSRFPACRSPVGTGPVQVRLDRPPELTMSGLVRSSAASASNEYSSLRCSSLRDVRRKSCRRPKRPPFFELSDSGFCLLFGSIGRTAIAFVSPHRLCCSRRPKHHPDRNVGSS